MDCFFINRIPDRVIVQTEEEWLDLKKHEQEDWQEKNILVKTKNVDSELRISLISPLIPIKRIKLRWKSSVPENLLFLNDHWERGYGDLEWRGLVPERIMPWYFMVYDGSFTHGYGVKTGCRAMCFWQVDSSGISLWLDVRCGGNGVRLGNRTLEAAAVIVRKGVENESPFEATRAFCSHMCSNPLNTLHPVYGGNNWYYAYGNSSDKQILEDSKLISFLAEETDERPFMVIDDGWQLCHANGNNGGPWHSGNFLFPDMEGLAQKMTEIGTQPGIWFRPLLTAERVPNTWLLPNKRFNQNVKGQFLDPSNQDVLSFIADDIKRITEWGYKLIKHDFSTYDIFGRWGFEMMSDITEDGWSFTDITKTTAEIILEFYQTIRRAAGDTLIIGCNTIGHIAAGIFEIQRTGDDTSGRQWERTRKYGINTLAFRMPQNGTFFAADADCVGLTNQIPWELNKQWLNLLSQSGTPLFVSTSREFIGAQQEKALKRAFKEASKPNTSCEPLDWMETVCPSKWLIDGNEVKFDWYGNEGIQFF